MFWSPLPGFRACMCHLCTAPHTPPTAASTRSSGRTRARRAASRVGSPATSRPESMAIRQLVPNVSIVFDRAQVEVMRGCTRGCRFCQAGMQSRPLRERPAGLVVDAADAILAATGYEEIGLTSLSTADYTDVSDRRHGAQAAASGCVHLTAEHPGRRLHGRPRGRHSPQRPTLRVHLRPGGGKPAVARFDQQGRNGRGDRPMRRARLRPRLGLDQALLHDRPAGRNPRGCRVDRTDLTPGARDRSRAARIEGSGQGQRLHVRAESGHALPVGWPGPDRCHRGEGRGAPSGAPRPRTGPFLGRSSGIRFSRRRSAGATAVLGP